MLPFFSERGRQREEGQRSVETKPSFVCGFVGFETVLCFFSGESFVLYACIVWASYGFWNWLIFGKLHRFLSFSPTLQAFLILCYVYSFVFKLIDFYHSLLIKLHLINVWRLKTNIKEKKSDYKNKDKNIKSIYLYYNFKIIFLFQYIYIYIYIYMRSLNEDPNMSLHLTSLTLYIKRHSSKRFFRDHQIILSGINHNLSIWKHSHRFELCSCTNVRDLTLLSPAIRFRMHVFLFIFALQKYF